MEELINQLDENQKEAVLSHKGFVRVMAGAGTGKTHVLILRILNLVNNLKVDPSKIVANTFTKKAAEEMKDRAILYGGDILRDVRFQTLHSFALKILRSYRKILFAEKKISKSNFTIMSQTESENLFESVNHSVFGDKPIRGNQEFLNEYNKIISICYMKMMIWKEKNIFIEDIKENTIKSNDEETKLTYMAYKNYQEAAIENSLLDFADLTMLAVKILKEYPDVRNEISKNIEFLLVDEFQDVNAVQIDFISLLTSYHRNLFIVGDDDQSLYSFRGSIPDIMQNITTRNPEILIKGLQDINLITNRRCTEQILDPAVKIVDCNHSAENPKILHSGKYGEDVSLSCYYSDTTEAQEIIKKINNILIKEKINLSEISILGRTKDSLQTVISLLDSSNISFKSYVGKKLREKEITKDLVSYMQLGVNPYLDMAFERIAAKPTRSIGAAAVNNILDVSKEKDIPIYEAILYVVEHNSKAMKKDKKDIWNKFSNDLKILSLMVEEDLSTTEILNYILNIIGYKKYFESKGEDVINSMNTNLKIIENNALNNVSVLNFIDNLSLEFEEGESKDINSVHVGTIHGSKGLEWEHVFLVAWEEGILPHQMTFKNNKFKKHNTNSYLNTDDCDGSREEERRLAHVGITRAKKNVYISYVKSRLEQRTRRYKTMKPSSFFKETNLVMPTKIIQTSGLKPFKK